MKDRIMYLDIDDTLLVWTNKHPGFAAPLADEFMKWALEHFEVRWMTMWCPSGRMRERGAMELEYRFNSTISAETFFNIRNPKGFIDNKTEAIDYNDPRPWVWVEDNLVAYEKRELENKQLMHNFYNAHVTNNVVALQSAWRKIAKRFTLPEPKYPYSTNPIVPLIILSDADMLEKFRNGKMQNHDADRPPEPEKLW